MLERHDAITATSTPMMTKSSVRPVLRAMDFPGVNLIRALQSFGRQFIGPGQDERDRETQARAGRRPTEPPSSESRRIGKTCVAIWISNQLTTP